MTRTLRTALGQRDAETAASAETMPTTQSALHCKTRPSLALRPEVATRVKAQLAIRRDNQAAIDKLDRGLVALGITAHPELDLSARVRNSSDFALSTQRSLLEHAQALGARAKALQPDHVVALVGQVAANTALLSAVAATVGAPPPGQSAVLAIVTTKEELESIVSPATGGTVASKPRPTRQWMSTDEVAEFLGYRPRYVAELVRSRGLPAHQPGGRGSRRSFRRSEVEAWARRGRR